MYEVKISEHTDIGDKKETNQDSIFSRYGVINGHNAGLFIVADGCGGLSCGDEISNLIVTYFSRVWNNELKEILENKKIDQDRIDAILEKTIAQLNESAKSFGEQIGSKVGSTLSLLLTIDDRYYIKNVGDSRIYLMRKGKFAKLTEDQTLVAEKVRSGELTEAEAINFKKKNVLTMCIGVFDVIHTYSKNGKIESGDVFLLCCDGLHNKIPEQNMINVIEDIRIRFEDKCEALRALIPYGQASDNVSSIMVEIKTSAKLNKRRKRLIAVLIIVLLALVLRHPVVHYVTYGFYKTMYCPLQVVECPICGQQFGYSSITDVN